MISNPVNLDFHFPDFVVDFLNVFFSVKIILLTNKVIFGRERSDQIINLIPTLSESKLDKVEVVHNEEQVVLELDLGCILGSRIERLTHDSDEHIHHVDDEDECGDDEEEVEGELVGAVSSRERRNVILA